MVFYRARHHHYQRNSDCPPYYYNLHNTASPTAEQVCSAAVSSRLSCVAAAAEYSDYSRLAHARARKNPINGGSAACVDVGGDKNICIHHHHDRRRQ